MRQQAPVAGRAAGSLLESRAQSRNHVTNIAMSSSPTQRRVHFSEVEIGQKFFDLISAEYFVKQSDDTAVMVSGIGDGVTADEFEPDDVVRIEEL